MCGNAASCCPGERTETGSPETGMESSSRQCGCDCVSPNDHCKRET